MKKIKFLRYLMSVMLLFMATIAVAQSTGDKLFLEGQQLQKTMTIASQNAAIKKFQAAKVVYTAAEKKQMCDNQITICNNNIKSIKAKAAADKKAKEEKEKEEQEAKEKAEKVEKPKEEVKLEVSPGKIEFKGNPNGKSVTVTVKSNYEWQVNAKPEWVDIFMAEDKFNVTVTENDTDDKRFGDIVVISGDKKATIKVFQKKLNMVDKVKKVLK